MTIYELLVKKRDELFRIGDVNLLQFDTEEIQLLNDVDHLRLLKITHTFYASFVPSSDRQDCAFKIINGDSDIYRVLELCVLMNRAIRSNVLSVFKELRGD